MVNTDDCMLWAGSKNTGGYGNLSFDGRVQRVHRVMYRVLVGEVPEGLELDHLCDTPPCFNTDHLEPVTHAENVQRYFDRNQSGICRNGHPRSRTTLIKDSQGRKPKKYCLVCHSLSKKRARARRKALEASIKERSEDER